MRKTYYTHYLCSSCNSYIEEYNTDIDFFIILSI